jgi:hypothetical protein
MTPSADSKPLVPIAAALLLLMIAACAPMQPAGMPSSRPLPTPAEPPPTMPPEEPEPVPPAYPVPQEPTPESSESPGPRTLAALNLVEQARGFLDRGRPDEALRILERSMRIDPGNPQSAYYLAEAWILKGNRRQAEAFHRLAAVHLSGDPQWTEKLRAQRRRLDRL